MTITGLLRLFLDFSLMALSAGLSSRLLILHRRLSLRDCLLLRRASIMLWVGMVLWSACHGVVWAMNLSPQLLQTSSDCLRALHISQTIVFAALVIAESPALHAIKGWSSYLARGQVPFHTDRVHRRWKWGQRVQVVCLAVLVTLGSINP